MTARDVALIAALWLAAVAGVFLFHPAPAAPSAPAPVTLFDPDPATRVTTGGVIR